MATTEYDAKWTLDEAVQLAGYVQPYLREAGFDVGITGSVLTRGESTHDLDLVVYPLTTEFGDPEQAAEALRKAGCTRLVAREHVTRQWRRVGSSDNKHVEVWISPLEKRVDVFFLR